MLSGVLARFGFPCCPLCHRDNSADERIARPACRELDEVDVIDGWSG
jgi:hypothetical protein